MPFSEYPWVIEVVRLAPEWMLLNRRSAETEFSLEVNRMMWYAGSMKKRVPPEVRV